MKTAARVGLVAGLLLAGLLAAGCGQPGRPQQAAMAACTQAGIRALRHHAVLAPLPAACRELRGARRGYAAGAAVAALAGTIHAKPLMRESRRELRPLLPHLAGSLLAPAAQPAAAPAGLPAGPPLRLDALAAWLITVALGGVMMARWITRGGLRGALAGHAAVMNFAHLGLAVAGLLAWLSYLVTGLAGLAWAACALLLPVTGLGMSLLVARPAAAVRPAEHLATAAVATAGGPVAAPGLPTARHLPVLVLAAHVAFAVATMLLTLLAAIG